MAVMWMRVNALLMVLVLLALVSIIGLRATGVRGGPLDPGGAPSPTGKTLEDVPGSWSRMLPADDGAPGPDPPAGCNSSRFQCVLEDNWAVLDRETGLVWTRYSDLYVEKYFWESAFDACHNSIPINGNIQFAGRAGWRLPTLEEMQSLLVLTGDVRTLPTGHPFINVQATEHWTASTYPVDTTYAYTLNPTTGAVVQRVKTEDHDFLCVRGQSVYDGR